MALSGPAALVVDMDNIALPALTFGPVPSRRLGRSLGINHIPPKTCTYACVYCQLGRTPRLQANRQTFYPPEAVVAAVQEKVADAAARGETIDYLTFVPDGEPTLDLYLGDMLTALKPLGIPLAVITNASLLHDEAVRAALHLADWVSLKMDAAAAAVWRQIDRPHGQLCLADILDGAHTFARAFSGALVTETMLVKGLNDTPETLAVTANVIAELRPVVAYLGVPTRPRRNRGCVRQTNPRSIKPTTSSRTSSPVWNSSSATRVTPLPQPATPPPTCSASPPCIRCATMQ